MNQIIFTLMNAAWGILIIFWTVFSLNAKRTSQKESVFTRFILYWLPLILAVYLLGSAERFGNSLIKGDFIAHNNQVGLAGFTLCLAGLVIACWSRLILGKNWSVSVQRKEDHELVKVGPYALVRHPIYSGLLLMFLGNAVIVGAWRGLLGFLIVFVSFWFKLKKEEKWLKESFVDYEIYMNRTKALIPWIL